MAISILLITAGGIRENRLKEPIPSWSRTGTSKKTGNNTWPVQRFESFQPDFLIPSHVRRFGKE